MIGTGGTITAEMVNGLWCPGKFTPHDLVNFIPELKDIASIITKSIYRIDSSNMQPAYWLTLAKALYENAGKYDGIVVTHGTDTMHYSASALSFLLQNLPIPVVLTGSQIPPHQTGTDVRRNLVDAVRVAAETNICEIVIVFSGKILRGNRAKKFREVEFEAYESVGMSPLGIIEHDIRLTGEHLHKGRLPLTLFDKIEKNVCILKITPGMNPRIISKLIEMGYKGIVLEGYGPGHLPIEENSLIPEIERAVKQNIPVIVGTQCALGSSWMCLYEVGKKALDAGAIPGYDMMCETVMTKLMWILGNFKNDMRTIKKLILKNISGEISSARSAKDKRIWKYDF
ncbi:MAG: hypothetical protein UW24_C0003G0040 [Parcubacteria group bacterium GW2011_GWA2_44_12]|nr:MAG: hypothetical protein UW24_C0003G0040 [Parcubacteria group bacterium GW2011_GWA2_44_12]